MDTMVTSPPGSGLTRGQGDPPCYHGDDHHYGPLVPGHSMTTTPQHRRTPPSTDRSAPRPSHMCHVIHCLLVTCFLVNILVLLGLHVIPYVTTHVTTTDVIHDVTRRSADQDTLLGVRKEQKPAPILRQLREAPVEEETLLASDADDVITRELRHALSPFTNRTSGGQTAWEGYRNRFTASNIAFPVNQPRICDDSTFLVVMVTSALGNADRRRTIRDTWGSVAKLNPSTATLIFLVGQPERVNLNQTKQLMEESVKHKDIIQANIIDSYSNLAFKSIAMLKWMDTYCKAAKYLLKSDDDMYINIDNLKSELMHSVHKRFIMGEIIAGAQPMQEKSSKWYTPKTVFSDRMYPKYVSGSAYVISGDFIRDLYRATQETQVFWLEDVYITGLCAKKAKATHVYNGKFGYKRRRLSPCLFKLVVTGHRLTTGEMHRVWEALKNPHLQCGHTNISA